MATFNSTDPLALDAGELPTARAWLERHDAWLAWNGTILGRAEGDLGWARYHQMAGDPVRAYEYANRAFARASDPRQPLVLLAAHRLLGELATDARQFADAEQHLQASLILADICAVPYERALTLLALATARVATNDRAGMESLIEEVRAICLPLDARPVLTRADALVARFALTGVAHPGYPAGLSVREVEVLRLVATGKSNREIAAALFLSPATVNVHITHILTKTNTDNRTAAAHFAREHGLA